MVPVSSDEEAKPLDVIYTRALQELVPVGSDLQSIPLRNRIGFLINLKTLSHLMRADRNTQMHMALLFAAVGSSTGFLPKSLKQSSVEFVDFLHSQN